MSFPDILQQALDSSTVEGLRVRLLNEPPSRAGENSSEYILYWCTQAFHREHNESLELAKALANETGLPLVVVVVFPLELFERASIRHIYFRLEGLTELRNSLIEMGIKMCFRIEPMGAPLGCSIVYSNECESYSSKDGSIGIPFGEKAYAIITDRPHLRYARAVTDHVAKWTVCPLVEVETKLVVPIEEAADGLVHNADEFIENLLPLCDTYVHPLPEAALTVKDSLVMDFVLYGWQWSFITSEWSPGDWMKHENELAIVLRQSKINLTVSDLTGTYKGGEQGAKKLLSIFLAKKLRGYQQSNQEFGEAQRSEYGSLLSPYLAHGFISPVFVAYQVLCSDKGRADITGFFVSLAKRELSFNFCYFNPGYDDYEQAIPEETRRILEATRHRRTAYKYTDEQWETGNTHDSRWNAVQHELIFRGRDIVQDRFFWAQKLIEYEEDPRNAYRLMITLNDRYMVDSNDPVGYKNVVECFSTCALNYRDIYDKEGADNSEFQSVIAEALNACDIEGTRVRLLNEEAPRKEGQYILYWCVHSPHEGHNEALELAKALANQKQLPVVFLVIVDLTHYLVASKRHIIFFLEGVSELNNTLKESGIKLIVRVDPNEYGGGFTGASVIGTDSVQGFAKRASVIVTDRPHLKHDRDAAALVAANAGCPVIDVETRLIVPLELMATDLETDPDSFMARFLPFCDEYVKQLKKQNVDVKASYDLDLFDLGWKWDFVNSEWGPDVWMSSEEKLNEVLTQNHIDSTVLSTSGSYRGGERAARKLVSIFVTRKLKGYGQAAELISSEKQGITNRSEFGSLLSPYFTHGFISPVEVAYSVLSSDKTRDDITSFFGSLGKRELSYNFIYFSADYKSYESTLPVDLRASLELNAKRRKTYEYTDEQWERGETHDSRWNGVQHELIFRGRDIVQDRFYWCQKLIEYEKDPSNAYRLALKLNDKYMLDATDAVGYMNVYQCFRAFNVIQKNRKAPEKNRAVFQPILAECIAETCVEPDRVKLMNDFVPRKSVEEDGNGEYVLYWAVHICHKNYNHSLEVAKAVANSMKLPLIVVVVIDLNHYKSASARHILYFMEGLADLATSIAEIGSRLLIRLDPAVEAGGAIALSIAGDENLEVEGFANRACVIVTDKPYLRYDRVALDHVVQTAGCPVVCVDTRLIVPSEVMSDSFISESEEFISKFFSLCEKYIHDFSYIPLTVRLPYGTDFFHLGYAKYSFLKSEWSGTDWLKAKSSLLAEIARSGIPADVSATSGSYKGGERSARKLLGAFIMRKLKGYTQNSETMSEDHRSEFGSLLSPYLSHGFISPVEVAYTVMTSDKSKDDITSFFASLGKRELSYHFVYFNPKYDEYDSVISPETHEMLLFAAQDRAKKGKTYEYTDEEWEKGQTHDSRWNAVQHELIFRGRDIVQDRFYWCQKLVEYETDPKNAYRLTLMLNDKYMVDAMDPIGYKNVSECFQILSIMGMPKVQAVEDSTIMAEILNTAVPPTGVEFSRIRQLNAFGPRPKISERGSAEYVLYLANHNCHREFNQALAVAKALANEAQLPLVVLAVLDLEHYRRASKRHVIFFLEGLVEFQTALFDIGAQLSVRIDPSSITGKPRALSVLGDSELEIEGFSSKAWAIVCDRVFLRHDCEMMNKVAEQAGCAVLDVETHLIVPVEVAADGLVGDPSQFLENFLPLCDEYVKEHNSFEIQCKIDPVEPLDCRNLGVIWPFMSTEAEWHADDWLRSEENFIACLKESGVDITVSATTGTYKGGERAARRLLSIFINRKLRGYDNNSSSQGEQNRSEYGSLLSPYLTHGFISPVEIAYAVLQSDKTRTDITSFFTSLAKRELCFNFAVYNPDYDDFDSVLSPEVKDSLYKAVEKRKAYTYTDQEWETAATHDSRWNSIQSELIFRGRDIVQDRFYWCQKLIEYETDPANAFRLAILMNDKFMLDATDPVSYKNVAECFRVMSALVAPKKEAAVNPQLLAEIIEKALRYCNTSTTLVRQLNDYGPRPSVAEGGSAEYVLYWSVHTTQTGHNQAFEIAKFLANTAKLPLVVLSTIDLEHFSTASKRHIVFNLEGVAEFQAGCEEVGATHILRIDPSQLCGYGTGTSLLDNEENGIIGLASKAWAIIKDRGHLRHDRRAALQVAEKAGCGVFDIETRIIVPIDVASTSFESDPDSFVSRFFPLCDDYVVPLTKVKLENVGTKPNLISMGYKWPFVTNEWTASDWLRAETKLNEILAENNIDPNISTTSSAYRGGEKSARRLLKLFVTRKLKGYNKNATSQGERNRSEYGSLLSPYLTHGFISPVEVAIEVKNSDRSKTDITAFFTSLAKRELSYNFVWFNENYDNFDDSVSPTVQKLLVEAAKIRKDTYVYTDEEWETGNTHDVRWNSIQHELIFRGRDIVQDRFFWCQKLVEYEQDPKNAYRLAVKLNDKYMIDATDPVGYMNVSECFRVIGYMNVPKKEAEHDSSVMQDILREAISVCGVEYTRVRQLNDLTPRPTVADGGFGEYVLYVCVRACHREHNEALELAKAIANRAELPLVVLAVIDLNHYVTASRRHIVFQLEGLQELQACLEEIGSRLIVRIDPVTTGGTAISVIGDEQRSVTGLAEKAYAIIIDRAHLRHDRMAADNIAAHAGCALIDVETRLIVPLEVMSEGLFDDAALFVEKFLPLCDQYVKPLRPQALLTRVDYNISFEELGMQWPFITGEWGPNEWLRAEDNLNQLLAANGIAHDVSAASASYKGGEKVARKLLSVFATRKLKGYADNSVHQATESNSAEYGSLLSPYLAHGFISPTEVALYILDSNRSRADITAFFTSLAKRELSYNFVYYTDNYSAYEVAVDEDVRNSLALSAQRRKTYEYTDDEWEKAETHDQRWNIVQKELIYRGRDIIQDRFYWCLKLVEYERDPANAYRLAIAFNDKYMLDATDPIGYKNVSECFSVAAQMLAEKSTADDDPSIIGNMLPSILAKAGVDESRVRQLNTLGPRPDLANGGAADYVLYWSVHTSFVKQNPALEVAKVFANELNLPLVVLYVIDLQFYRHASKRHVIYLLEGLVEYQATLSKQGAKVAIRIDPVFSEDCSPAVSVLGHEEKRISGFADKAALIIKDRGHLKHDIMQAEKVASTAMCGVLDVESRLIVPASVISDRLCEDVDEYMSNFLSLCDRFVKPTASVDLEKKNALDISGMGYSWPCNDFEWGASDWLRHEDDLGGILKEQGIDDSVSQISGTYRGGETCARKLLNVFISRKLKGYYQKCTENGLESRSEYGSLLSAYLARGFISPIDVAYTAMQSSNPKDDISVFIASLAKRELSYNLCLYNKDYDSYDGVLPEDTRKKLKSLADNYSSAYEYTDAEWETGETHDTKWNAVQHELIFRGRDIVQDRFYWCQKIIQYEKDPRNAYRLALLLNDKYMVDSCDPVGYKNISECFVAYAVLGGVEKEKEEINANHKHDATEEFTPAQFGSGIRLDSRSPLPFSSNHAPSRTKPLDSCAKGSIKQILKSALETCKVERSRVRLLNDRNVQPRLVDGGFSEYVLYWCSGSFRITHNESLEVAKAIANSAGLPLVVIVSLDLSGFRRSSSRMVEFLLEGLTDFEKSLTASGVKFILSIEKDSNGFIECGVSNRAWAIVTDREHMRHARTLSKRVASHVGCPVIDVESRLVCPVESVANSVQSESEFCQIFMNSYEKFVKVLPVSSLQVNAKDVIVSDVFRMWPFMNQQLWGPSDWLQNSEVLYEVLAQNMIDTGIPRCSVKGGERAVLSLLPQILETGDLSAIEFGGSLSCYLSCGFLSSVHLFEQFLSPRLDERKKSQLTHAVAKREYSYNLSYYNHQYDSYIGSIPAHVRQGMDARRQNPMVGFEELQRSLSPDEKWNFVHAEKFVAQGCGFGADFPYWCHRIIDFSGSAEAAYETIIRLGLINCVEFTDPVGFLYVADAFLSYVPSAVTLVPNGDNGHRRNMEVHRESGKYGKFSDTRSGTGGAYGKPAGEYHAAYGQLPVQSEPQPYQSKYSTYSSYGKYGGQERPIASYSNQQLRPPATYESQQPLVSSYSNQHHRVSPYGAPPVTQSNRYVTPGYNSYGGGYGGNTYGRSAGKVGSAPPDPYSVSRGAYAPRSPFGQQLPSYMNQKFSGASGTSHVFYSSPSVGGYSATRYAGDPAAGYRSSRPADTNSYANRYSQMTGGAPPPPSSAMGNRSQYYR